MPEFDVVVIGSGPGGATAADVLTDAGKSVCVLEKGRNHLLALGAAVRRARPPVERRGEVRPSPLPRSRPAARAAHLPALDGRRRAPRHPRRSTTCRRRSAAPVSTPTASCRAIARSTSASLSELGPVEGAEVADWPLDYDELEPFYAEAERAHRRGRRPHRQPVRRVAQRSVSDATGRRHVPHDPDRARGRDARIPPVPRADRRQQRALRRSARVQQLRVLRLLRLPDRRQGRPGRHAAPLARARALRAAPREHRGRDPARRPRHARRPACATSTATVWSTRCTADAVVVAVRRVRNPAPPAAQRHRELVGPRRSLPHVPPADDRARVLPVPAPRLQGPRRHAPHGRPDRRRRRERRRRTRRGAALPARRHRRARWQRPPDLGGALPPTRPRPHRAHARLDHPRQDGRLHHAGRGPAPVHEPRRSRRRRARRVGTPGGSGDVRTRTRTRSRARTTGGRGSRPCCERRARQGTSWVTSPGTPGTIAPDIEPMSKHWMGTARMGTDPGTSVCDPWQRLWDVDNVVVTDSSVFPTSTGYGPTLTLVALALRAAGALAASL